MTEDQEIAWLQGILDAKRHLLGIGEQYTPQQSAAYVQGWLEACAKHTQLCKEGFTPEQIAELV